MDLLKDSVRPLYFRYLAAAFGSALITSVYSVVDMAVVGQAVGPQGTAALAGACVLAGAAWLLLWLWEEPILVFFGADAQLLELAQRYLEPVKIVVRCSF